jgi:putative ABC transport system permease protein
MAQKTPLAWLQLTRQKSRFFVALAGIAFADLLMFIQMGFQDALFDAAAIPHRNFKADLAVVNPQFQTMFSPKSFSREYLYQTLANPAIQTVSPIYISLGQWRNPETRLERTILAWGIQPDQPTFKFLENNNTAAGIKQLERVIYDRAGRLEFGNVAEAIEKTGKFETELNGRSIYVAGLFSLGASFAADGNVIMSDSTFLNVFSGQKADQINVGLITLKPGSNPEQVKAQLRQILPKEVDILTPEEFAQIEIKYWETATAIGFIFGIGVTMGFIVGIVIVYQILYSDVSDHLPEYATLKAMGYRDRYLLGVVMQEAIILAIMGYIPGFALSVGLYNLAQGATMLPIGMSVARAINVFLLTHIMCLISGAIAVRKLSAADPADIF